MTRHVVQLELYRVLMDKWLAVNNLSTFFRVDSKACVWLMNEPWWTPVSETGMRRSSLTVKQFRSSGNDGSLQSLIRKMCSSPKDIQWRLERRCGGCVYQGHCTSEAAGTIHALPDQSTEAQSIFENTLSEVAQASEIDMEDMYGAVELLPRHVSLYFSEGLPSEEAPFEIHTVDQKSQLVRRDCSNLPQTFEGQFIFDHIEGVREARAIVVRGNDKDTVRRYIALHRHFFQGKLVIGLDRWRAAGGNPHPDVLFVLDSRGAPLTYDLHWLVHRIHKFEEDEESGEAHLEFRHGGIDLKAQGIVRKRKQTLRSLREISIKRDAFTESDVQNLRFDHDDVYRLTVSREEMIRCHDAVVEPPMAHAQVARPDLCVLPQQGDSIEALNATSRGMTNQLFRSRQKLAAYHLGRVLPYDIKHKTLPLFAEDVGVYFNINSDPHLGDTSSECIFSWTVLIRYHASNVERVIMHCPKSKARPHDTLIEFVHALFEQISDHNAAILSDAEESGNALSQLVKLQCYVFDPGEVSPNQIQ